MKRFETILWESQETTLVIKLNRPDKLNAINAQMLSELDELFSDLSFLESYSSIVVTGIGKAFAAGADISELAQCTAENGAEFSRHGQHVYRRIELCPIPVIAAVNGYALGGGCELALACHLRFASTTALFGQPEVKLGIIPGYGGTQRLPRLIGISRALELMITGEYIDAERALSWGLVNRVYESDELLDRTMEFCRYLAQKPLQAIRSLLHIVTSSISENYELEAQQFGILCGTEDFLEGTRAFLERRSPVFRGK